MNANETFDTAPAPAELIGLAFTFPVAGQFTGVGSCLFCAWATSVLERAGAGPAEVASIFAGNFMLLKVVVGDRHLAFRELRRTLEETPPGCLWALAYFDSAEEIWRTYAGDPNIEFEELNKPAALESAARYSAAELTAVAGKLGIVRSEPAP